jgi:hypothetical protein
MSAYPRTNNSSSFPGPLTCLRSQGLWRKWPGAPCSGSRAISGHSLSRAHDRPRQAEEGPMSTTPHEIFRNTLQETHLWLREVLEELCWEDEAKAYLPYAIGSRWRRLPTWGPSCRCSSGCAARPMLSRCWPRSLASARCSRDGCITNSASIRSKNSRRPPTTAASRSLRGSGRNDWRGSSTR